MTTLTTKCIDIFDKRLELRFQSNRIATGTASRSPIVDSDASRNATPVNNCAWESRINNLLRAPSLSTYQTRAKYGNFDGTAFQFSKPDESASSDEFAQPGGSVVDGWCEAQHLLLHVEGLFGSTLTQGDSQSEIIVPKKVELAFALLDRMVAEESSSTIRVDYRILNHIVDWWRLALRAEYKQQQQQQQGPGKSSRHDNGSPSQMASLLPPSQLVAKLNQYRSSSAYFQPSTETYNMVLDAAASTCCNAKIHHDNKTISLTERESEEGIWFCQNLLEWMIDEGQRDASVRPDAVTFRTLMRAWTFSGVDDELSLAQCERLAQRWYDYAAVNPDGDMDKRSKESLQASVVAPHSNTSIVTKGLIHAYAAAALTTDSSSSSLLAERAEYYLVRMAQDYLQASLDLEAVDHQIARQRSQTDFPETALWNRAIAAYGKTGSPQRARALLDKYLEFYETAVVKAERESSAARSLLTSICQPTVHSYNHVLDGWMRAGNITEADDLLLAMQSLGNSRMFSQCRPNESSYTSVMKANLYNLDRSRQLMQQFLDDYERQQLKAMESRHAEQSSGIHPNHLSPNQKAGRRDGSFYTETEARGSSDGHISMDVTIFNVLLAACAKASDVDHAIKVFDKEMKFWDIAPDRISYSCMLQTFRASSDGDSALEFWKQHIEPHLGAEAAQVSGLKQQLEAPLGVDDIVDWISTISQLPCRQLKDLQSELLQQLLPQYLVSRGAKLFTWHRLLRSLCSTSPSTAEVALDLMPAPTDESFLIVIRAWEKSKAIHAGDRAEKVFRRWQRWRVGLVSADGQREQQGGDKPYHEAPSPVELYTSVMMAWANKGKVAETKSIFDELYHEFETTGDQGLKPQEATITAVLKACANAPIAQPVCAEDFLLRALRAYRAGQIDIKPDTVMFNIVLNCWAKAKTRQSGKRAEEIFQQMENPDVVSFNTVVKAYVWAGQLDQAERLVQSLTVLPRSVDHELSPSKQGGLIRPDMASIRTILTGWTRSRNPNAAERADAFLSSMVKAYMLGTIDEMPSLNAYGLTIHAWAASNLPQAGQRAEALLCSVLKMVDTLQWEKVISRDDLKTALTDMFCNAMRACKGDGDRAEAMLRKMCHEFSHGNEFVKPNSRAFNIVLESLAMAPTSSVVGERAESLLNEMRAMYDSGQLDAVKPTIETYNLVLKCFDKSSSTIPEFGQRAVALIHDMQTHCKPNLESYKAAMYATANTGDIGRTEALFAELVDVSKRNRTSTHVDIALKPDIGCLHAILKACRTARNPERAMSVLHRWERGWEDSGALGNLALSAQAYNIVLACLADQGMATEADDLLIRMQQRGVSPTDVSYNTLLNAWANSGLPESVSRAEALVLGEMLTVMRPNLRTYTIWLKLIAASSVPDKQSQFEKVLAMMKKDGFRPVRGKSKQISSRGANAGS